MVKKIIMSLGLALLVRMGQSKVASRRQGNANEKMSGLPETTEAFILERKNAFSQFQGEINAPLQVASYYEFVSRRTGRTTAMIEAIIAALHAGEQRIGLMVHKQDYGKDLVNQITKTYPHIDKSRIIILSTANENWKNALRGKSKFPIFVDNAVTDVLTRDYIKTLNDRWPL